MFNLFKKVKTVNVISGSLEVEGKEYSFTVQANSKDQLLGFAVRGYSDKVVSVIRERLESIMKMKVTNPGIFIVTDLAVSLDLKTTDIAIA